MVASPKQICSKNLRDIIWCIIIIKAQKKYYIFNLNLCEQYNKCCIHTFVELPAGVSSSVTKYVSKYGVVNYLLYCETCVAHIISMW